MRRLTPIYYLLLALSLPATAQHPLYGRIKRQLSTEVLPSVTILNHTQGKHNTSDAGGNYRIDARPGDTIIVTSAGYLPDTNYVAAWMLAEKNGYDIFLRPNVVRLSSVLIGESSNYQKDSLQRRAD